MTVRTSLPDATTESTDDHDALETRVPEGATVYACDRCGRPFARERYLVLHRGLEHADLSVAERDAFETARETEADALWRYRIAALGALVVLYFGLLYAYALV
jgi:hypothetical protein